MQNIPRRDPEKKLMSSGIQQTSKHHGSSLNLGSSINSNEMSVITVERFNEESSQQSAAVSSRQHTTRKHPPQKSTHIGSITLEPSSSNDKVTALPEINTGQVSTRSSLAGLTASKKEDKLQNQNTEALSLLIRMGYGGYKDTPTASHHTMSTSLLASQREAYRLQVKNQTSVLRIIPPERKSLPNPDEMSKWMDQSQASRFDNQASSKAANNSRFFQSSRRRIELTNLVDKFSGDVRRKLEHWHGVSSLLELELEEKSNSYPDISASIGEKVIEINGFIGQMVRMIYTEYLTRLEESVKAKLQVSAAEEKVIAVQLQREQVNDMLKEKNAILKRFLDVGNSEEMRSKKERRSNYIAMENLKLAAENQQLAAKLHQAENGDDISTLRLQLQTIITQSAEKQDHATKEIDFKDKEIIKRKQQLSSMQAQLAKVINQVNFIQAHLPPFLVPPFPQLDLEVRQFRARVDEQEVELNQLRVENTRNYENYVIFRERAMMCSEDYRGMLEKTSEQRHLLVQLREKSQSLKAKLDKFTIARSKEVEVPNDGSFPNDLKMLQVIQGEFSKDKSFFKQALASAKKLPAGDSLHQRFSEILQGLVDKHVISTTSSSYEETPLSSLQLSLPNFYVFVEACAKNYELDMQNMKNRKISLSFIGQMRVVLDSKYNELMLLESTPRQISKFPDFVFSWFGKFTVDQSTRQVRLITEPEKQQVDDTRVIFLLDLTNPKLAGVWEVVTFKEFLSEKAQMDEIYFYLHCRNLLFRGPSLFSHESTFDVVQYVSIDRAEQLIDVMMAKYDPINVMLIKKQVKEKVIIKNNGRCHFIEAGIVLRILLEFYRIERRNRFKLLKEAFLSQSSIGSTSGKFCISFPAFRKILIMNFPESTDQEIAQLYREAYSIGQGSVTIDAFYTAANDTNFFLKFLQLNSFVKLPVLDQTTGHFDQSALAVNESYENFYQIFEGIRPSVEVLLSDALRFGVDRVYNEAEEVNYLISRKFQQDVALLRGKPFFYQVNKIMSLWSTINTMRLFQYHLQPDACNGGFDESQTVMNDFETMQRVLANVNPYVIASKIAEKEKNNNIKRVQRVFRKKISKFYSFVSSLLSAKLKNSVKDNQKTNRKVSQPDLPDLSQPSPLAKKQQPKPKPN